MSEYTKLDIFAALIFVLGFILVGTFDSADDRCEAQHELNDAPVTICK